MNTGGDLARYPGSPLVALALMRKTDRLVANELHPEDAATLDDVIGGDRRVKVLQLDAYTALKSLLPPPERRGVVLVDPPFEARDEFDLLMRGLREATRRFATGTYLIWYPIKDRSAVAAFHDEIMAARHAKASCDGARYRRDAQCLRTQRMRAHRHQSATHAQRRGRDVAAVFRATSSARIRRRIAGAMAWNRTAGCVAWTSNAIASLQRDALLP